MAIVYLIRNDPHFKDDSLEEEDSLPDYYVGRKKQMVSSCSAGTSQEHSEKLSLNSPNSNPVTSYDTFKNSPTVWKKIEDISFFYY